MSECIVHKESLRCHWTTHQSSLLRSRSRRPLSLDDSRVAEACLVNSPFDMSQSFGDDSSVFLASPRSTEVNGSSLFDLTPTRPFNTSPNPQRRLFSCPEDKSLTTPSLPCLQSLFYDINEDVGASWKKLGRHLSIKECVLNNINEDYRGVSEKAIQVLFKWKEDNGASATPEALFSALLHIRRTDVAKKLIWLVPSLLPKSRLMKNVVTSDCTLYASYTVNPENLKVKKVLESKDEKVLVCSTSESSERFLLKQVKDKENTFAVRKCLDCKALRQQHKQLRKTEEFLKELEMKQKMVQDLLNVIDQLQNHLLTQHQAITQEQVSCHNCGQYNIKRDLLFKELTLLHHELERMIKSNRRISISGIPTERIYNLATRICFACEEHKEMHKHNKRRQSFCQHPENLTESDEGDDYIEGPLMCTLNVIFVIGRRRKVTQSFKPKKSTAGDKMKLTKSNSNPLSSSENLGVSKRHSYLLAQESQIMISSVEQSQSPRDWSGVPAFTMCSDLKVPCSNTTLSKCKKEQARNPNLAENPSTAKLGRNSQETISLHWWEGLDEGEMII